MSTLTAYYRLEVLNKEVRALNGIKSANRLDCTAVYNPSDHGLISLFQRPNGMLFFYLIPTRDIVKVEAKRRTMYTLGDGKQNLTSLYFEYLAFSRFCYGYPNGKEWLTDGSPNLAAPYKHDAFLMICDWQQQVVELLVVQNAKPIIDKLYRLLIDGKLNGELDRFRQLARTYYPYNRH